MSRDDYQKPEQLSGYSGEQERPVEGGPPVRTKGQSASQNRGMRAPREGSGAVIGSGAGAGGGGDEDYDTDSAGGGGGDRIKTEKPHPDTRADAPIGGSR